MAMNFEKIKEHREDRIMKLDATTDRYCEERVRQLVKQLPRFQIQALIMGMGTWTVNGPDITFIDEDGETVEREISELFDWVDSENQFGTNEEPAILMDGDFDLLLEFYDLCSWWIDATGGLDIDFTNEKENGAV